MLADKHKYAYTLKLTMQSTRIILHPPVHNNTAASNPLCDRPLLEKEQRLRKLRFRPRSKAARTRTQTVTNPAWTGYNSHLPQRLPPLPPTVQVGDLCNVTLSSDCITGVWVRIPLLPLCNVTLSSVPRGATVSTSVFLACHQCYCACSSLAWGLNLRA